MKGLSLNEMKYTDRFGLAECPQCKKRAFFPIYEGYMKLRLCKTCPFILSAVPKIDLGGDSSGSAFGRKAETKKIKKQTRYLKTKS